MGSPKYVRLPDRLAGRIVADLDSGWAISGSDVKEYPKDDQAAAAFVDSAINSGRLEPAGRAEFEEVNAARKATAEAVAVQKVEVELTSPHQEHKVQAAAKQAEVRTAEKRGAADAKEAEEEKKRELEDPEAKARAAQEEERAAARRAEEEKKRGGGGS